MPTLCTVCSLLCDSASLHQECQLRESALRRLVPTAGDNLIPSPSMEGDTDQALSLRGADDRREEVEPLPDLSQIQKLIKNAKSIHVAGGITSVETSRAVLQFAKLTQASVDGLTSVKSDATNQSMARVGAYLTSLAEARSISDCIIIVGNDEIDRNFPMLSSLLASEGKLARSSEGTDEITSPVVLLLGEFSEKSLRRWSERYDVIRIPCPLENAPIALLDFWTLVASQSPLTKHAKAVDDGEAGNTRQQSHAPYSTKSEGKLRAVCQATYTTVVTSSLVTDRTNSEIWYGQMFQALDCLNQTKRGGLLNLSSLSITFQNVCLWTTGFPNAVQFDQSDWRYDPVLNTTEGWLKNHFDDEDALLIVCDETSEEGFSLSDTNFAGWKIVLTNKPFRSTPSTETDPRTILIPIATPGIDCDASVYRCDGVLLAHTEREFTSQRHPAKDWFRKLAL